MDTDAFLLECYKEDNTHARHLENQRLEIAKFLLTVQVAIVGAAGYLMLQPAQPRHQWMIALLEVIFVVFAHRGLSVTNALLYRFFSHRERANAIRNWSLIYQRLSLPFSPTGGAIETACTKIEKGGPRFRTFWRSIYIGMIAVGDIAFIATARWLLYPYSCLPLYKALLGFVLIIATAYSLFAGWQQWNVYKTWEKKQENLNPTTP